MQHETSLKPHTCAEATQPWQTLMAVLFGPAVYAMLRYAYDTLRYDTLRWARIHRMRQPCSNAQWIHGYTQHAPKQANHQQRL